MNQHFFNLLRIVIFSILLNITNTAVTQTCQPHYVLGATKLHLPCVDELSDPTARKTYQADLLLTDPEAFLFKWDTKTPLPEHSLEIGAVFEPNSMNLYIPFISVETAPSITLPYQVILQEDASGILSITQANPLADQTNNRPTATPVSIQMSSSASYQTVQLTGNDPDGDTLAFELLAPYQGEGYTLAYITSSNILYVILQVGFQGQIELPYRVTDGKIFSHPVEVSITVSDLENNNAFFLGSQEISAREFAGIRSLRAVSKLSSSGTDSQGQSSLPSQIDLSAQFPTPGYQGQQNSCVAWSVAYAVKSYQEGLEEGWSLTTQDHLFSPAYIYNQLNGGSDNGLKVSDALAWVVDNGMATLATVPYEETNYTTQPTTAATKEAQLYKPLEWGTLKSNNDIKTSLANQQPVIITMAVYNSLKNLKGSNSVYNTADTWIGEHAVTLVGYDDGHASGGAFKVMNSWGTDWGNQGFFWLPYDFTHTQVQINGQNTGSLVSGAYVLVDQENTSSSINESIPPVSTGELPNLVITDLQVNSDQLQPGAFGQLQYTIANQGTVTVPAQSAWVDLVLSQNPNLSQVDYQSDTYQYYHLTNQMIASELIAGQSVTQNVESFLVPLETFSGQYYLYLIVDGYDQANNQVLTETDQSDNIKMAQANPLIIFGKGGGTPNPGPALRELPNLQITDWEADYDTFQPGAEGELRYTLTNAGLDTVPVNAAGMMLILSTNPALKFNNYYYDEFYLLTGEVINVELLPGEATGRTEENPLPFSFPEEMPPADYYLYLVVDAHDEINNQPIMDLDYRDNISPPEKALIVEKENTTPLPDLIAEFWFAEWDHKTGAGNLEYAITNEGVTDAKAGWDITLLLSSVDRFNSDGKPVKEILWQKEIKQTLIADFEPEDPANQPSPFYVDQNNPEPINVYKDINGKPVPPGFYDLVLRLDSNKIVKEYDEDNDFYSGILVEAPKSPPPPSPLPRTSRRKIDFTHQAYNGKYLPKTRFNVPSQGRTRSTADLPRRIFAKTIRSEDHLIFPIERLTLMPPVKTKK